MPQLIDITQPTGPRRPGPTVHRAPPEPIPLFPQWVLATGAWTDAGYWLDNQTWQDAA